MATLCRSSHDEFPDALSNGWLVALGVSLILIGLILGPAFTTWLLANLAAAVIAAIGAVTKLSANGDQRDIKKRFKRLLPKDLARK